MRDGGSERRTADLAQHALADVERPAGEPIPLRCVSWVARGEARVTTHPEDTNDVFRAERRPIWLDHAYVSAERDLSERHGCHSQNIPCSCQPMKKRMNSCDASVSDTYYAVVGVHGASTRICQTSALQTLSRNCPSSPLKVCSPLLLHCKPHHDAERNEHDPARDGRTRGEGVHHETPKATVDQRRLLTPGSTVETLTIPVRSRGQ
jgi:hypothetical protein